MPPNTYLLSLRSPTQVCIYWFSVSLPFFRTLFYYLRWKKLFPIVSRVPSGHLLNLNLLFNPSKESRGESHGRWNRCEAEWIQFWSKPQEEHTNSVIQNPAPNAITLAVFGRSEHSLWQMCQLLETTRGGKRPFPADTNLDWVYCLHFGCTNFLL